MTCGNIDRFDPHDRNDIRIVKEAKRIIYDTIKKIRLDLSGLKILTEAATGNWIYTPFIAALANASCVICVTKDSKYGKAKDIVDNFNKLTKYFDVENKINIYKKLSKNIIQKADVVTNSGLLRPIDKKFISNMKKSAVISLMWEPWEYRSADLDLSECWKNNICVLGVNEDNKILNCMSYAGDLIKKIFEMYNVTLQNKNVILVAENISALYMIRPLKSAAASLVCVSKTMTTKLKEFGAKVIGQDLTDIEVEPFLRQCHIIIIDSFPIKKTILGGSKGFNVSKLKKMCPDVKIFVYFGKVNYVGIKKCGIDYYPEDPPRSGHMGWTADILGPAPTIESNALGLKVGELLAFNRLSGLGPREAELKALQSPFCLDFSDEQRLKHSKKTVRNSLNNYMHSR